MSIFNLKPDQTSGHPEKKPKYDMPVGMDALKKIFADCSDFSSREIAVGGGSGKVTVCYIDGITDGTVISETVVRPLTQNERFASLKSSRELVDGILSGAVYSATAHESDTMDAVVSDLVNGFCVLVFDLEKTAVSFETRTSTARSVSEPTIEKSIKGPRDAFVETMRVNTSLIRRHLRDPNLKILSKTAGRRSNTSLAVCYMDGIADPGLVEEILHRLDAIDIDGMLTPVSLEEYIIDSPRSPMPQVLHTERPDRFCMNMLEGRVGVIADGIPIGFIMPTNFHEFFRTPEDQSHHFLSASVSMGLRYLAMILSVLFPAVFVAIAMYHQEMIPTKLLLSLIESKKQVPFNTAIEVLGLLLSFSILQEAGLRLPDASGQTVSLIGALIVGQAAVEAKIVSPIAIIVFAISAISGYLVTDTALDTAYRVYRVAMVLAGIFFGLFGIMVLLMLAVYHICSLESLGVPYITPLDDGQHTGLWRFILRAPMRRKKYRPESVNPQNKRNQA